MATLQERLERGDVVILDGAMGTELQRRGVPMDGIAWSATAMATHSDTERASYREQAALLAEAGADLLALEMIRDIDQGRTIVEAAAATGLPVCLGFTCRLSDDGESVLLRGRDAERPLQDCMGEVLAAGSCSVVSIMHSDINATNRALDTVLEGWAGPIACYPECGEWENPNWRFGDLTPEAFAAAAEIWVDRGVQIVGGCCGIGPDHIARFAERVSGRQVGKRENDA